MTWDMVIGLEVHMQLATQSKLFSRARTSYGAPANSQTSFIDAGLPGVLPVLNSDAVALAIQFGLAIEGEINNLSYFERKNYFYPDLPKGYQISQYGLPIVSNGRLEITTAQGTRFITIERAHLEEDAGKSLHELHDFSTGIDLNRAGIPLLEVVTTPCITSSDEAVAYLKTLHQLVRFLGICDGNMQEGSFRCDVNLSIKPKGVPTLGTRVELKNLNSFRFIEKAIAYEFHRQHELLSAGDNVKQETRLFDPDLEQTFVLRDKEDTADYRYFPDPDLLPIVISDEQFKLIKDTLPPLPTTVKHALSGLLSEEEINFILSSKEVYDFYRTIKENTSVADKTIVNWLKGSYSSALNEQELTFKNAPVSALSIAQLLDKIDQKIISNSIGKQVFQKLWLQEGTVNEIIKRENYQQISDNDTLLPLVLRIISQYPEQVQQYQQGKTKVLGFFIGQIMKETKGQANPEEINALVIQHLTPN